MNRRGILNRRAKTLSHPTLRGVRICILLFLSLIGFQAFAADDQEPTGAPPATSNSEAARPPAPDETAPPLTAKQEKAVRRFVQAHHPQLARVLAHLEVNRPQDYQRALRDLNRHRVRLAQMRSRDPERHQLELKLWKLQSRAQLMAARLSMTNEQDLEKELRKLLDEQLATRLEIARREQQRLAERKAHVDEQIREMEENGEQLIERHLQLLLERRSRRPPDDKP